MISMILTTLVIIPIIPLIAYAIGLVVPATHIVSRSFTFKISAIKLWSILTDVSKYPAWQQKVKDVIIDEIDIKNKKVVFVEYSTRKSKTLVINHELVPLVCLIRILEESPCSMVSNKYQLKNTVPTFSGSWAFDITQEKENNQIALKITEQGVIKNPFARITHLLFLGYHYRIDQFFMDLEALIDKENASTDSKEQKDMHSADLMRQDTQVVKMNGVNNIAYNEKTEVADDVLLGHAAEANDIISEVDIISKVREWGSINEIYKRPTQIKTS